MFFEHRGLLEGRDGGRARHRRVELPLPVPRPSARRDLEAVVADVRALGADEVGRGGRAARADAGARRRTLLAAAAAALRARFDAGGRLLALGNGGSATDAMDVVADLRRRPRGWPARPALDLTEDPAILTALANDIGVEAIFARQVIAHGAAGRRAARALHQRRLGQRARRARRGAPARPGHDRARRLRRRRIAAERLADHVVVTRSEHIPRIQEAQASAYHVLRELVELPGT